MRKTARWLAPLLMLLVLFAGCQSQEGKSSLAPYDLEESQEELLSLLGMRDTAQLFSYQCPQGTLAVTASTYVLENGEWVSTGEGTISWDEETEESQDGVFSLIYQEDRSFRMALHGKGTSTFCSDPITPSVEPTAFSHSWLSQEVEIRLGQEIPVALFVSDSGSQMASFTVEDYFSPEGFGEMDLVQAVTLTFSQEA